MTIVYHVRTVNDIIGLKPTETGFIEKNKQSLSCIEIMVLLNSQPCFKIQNCLSSLLKLQMFRRKIYFIDMTILFLQKKMQNGYFPVKYFGLKCISGNSKKKKH